VIWENVSKEAGRREGMGAVSRRGGHHTQEPCLALFPSSLVRGHFPMLSLVRKEDAKLSSSYCFDATIYFYLK